ncbi:cytosine permease [Sporomusa sphaeroides]|uniref:Cytosine permease n=1 Tax=Sporomusa sphaeroides DSM 2875 TaxID=1337886 RepID=A0ABP2C4V5_9FIRM|nr:cytosine permease [Sporomusa sphaeroides]OLS54999.1 cytosine permease [Sporomusa sphaeroides DSM 2875]CVK19445.1 Cytosine permease [Sporomusa sphaeroides DSM 2875]
MKENVQLVDRDFSLSEVPQTERRGFWSMFVLMVGFTFFSASMWAGGTLGAGLTAWEFIFAVLGGNILLGIYTGALSYIAASTGLSTHLLARYAFGEKGSQLASLMLSVTQVGWFGVGVVMFALPVQKVTGLNLYLLIVVGGLLMSTTAYWGIKALTILSVIAVPSIALLGAYSVGNAVESIGGLQALMLLEPAEKLSFATALTICVGSFISGGTLSPDFTRFAKTRTVGVSTTVIAFFLGNSLMFLFGAMGAAATGQADISEVMFLQGLIVPAIIILGLNIWTTNDNALYASGLGFSNITGIPKQKLVLFNGFIGTLLAFWLYTNFIGFLTFLGSTLPPIGGIIIADYFLVQRRCYPPIADMQFEAVRWHALAAWAGGVALAHFAPGIPPVNAILGSGIVYVTLSALRGTAKESAMQPRKAG